MVSRCTRGLEIDGARKLAEEIARQHAALAGARRGIAREGVHEDAETKAWFFPALGAKRFPGDAAYREEFGRWLRLYETGFSSAEIAYGAFLTDQPWDAALGRLLASWQ